jgi:hypothetical protein
VSHRCVPVAAGVPAVAEAAADADAAPDGLAVPDVLPVLVLPPQPLSAAVATQAAAASAKILVPCHLAEFSIRSLWSLAGARSLTRGFVVARL